MGAITDQESIEIVYDDGYPAGYTIMDNRDIWEERDIKGKRVIRPTFTPKAFKAWVGLISLRGRKKEWSFSFTDIRDRLDMGRDALRAALAELEAKGRLERLNVRKPDGTYGLQRWILHPGGRRCPPPPTPPTRENPARTDASKSVNKPKTENQAPASTSPWKSGDGPATENQAPVSTSYRKPSRVPTPDAEATDYTVALKSGAGVSVPLVSTEVVKNKKTTTTTQPSSSHDLVPPTSLPPDAARVVVAEVEKAVRNGSLRGDLAQPVLDELEGAVRRGRQGTPIAKPVSYLLSLLRRAQTGQFVPDAGLPIGRERQKQALEVENRVRRDEERRQHAAERDDPKADRRIRALLDECSRALRMPPRAPRDAGPQLKTSASP
jgi:hypothetical protein